MGHSRYWWINWVNTSRLGYPLLKKASWWSNAWSTARRSFNWGLCFLLLMPCIIPPIAESDLFNFVSVWCLSRIFLVSLSSSFGWCMDMQRVWGHRSSLLVLTIDQLSTSVVLKVLVIAVSRWRGSSIISGNQSFTMGSCVHVAR